MFFRYWGICVEVCDGIRKGRRFVLCRDGGYFIKWRLGGFSLDDSSIKLCLCVIFNSVF